MKEFKTIDLFAGLGGIRIAFEREGFKTVFANDFDKYCKITYDQNFKELPMKCEDIKLISANNLPEFDLLLGGFPCQPFSIAGYRKGFEDENRGDLFFTILNILKESEPTSFLLENVKNLKSHDNGETIKFMVNELEKIGYNVTYKVLNTCDYGNLPQNRERIYIVGFKDKQSLIAFNFPDPIKLTVKLTDILEKNVDSKYYYTARSKIYDKIKDEVINKDTCYQWRRVYVRENKNNLSPTLTANMGTGGHNVPIIRDENGIRKLTPRECARLQGFPDSYLFPNLADSRLYKQFGNSVSIPVIQRIAHNIKIALDSVNKFNKIIPNVSRESTRTSKAKVF
jgi:DNA (cytosine-5)-methyltransferase 1